MILINNFFPEGNDFKNVSKILYRLFLLIEFHNFWFDGIIILPRVGIQLFRDKAN